MNIEHILYWLWLVTKCRGAHGKMNALINLFGSVEEVYASKSFDGIRGLTDGDKTLLMSKDLSRSERIAEAVARIGGKIIVIDDENYPQILKNTHNPPPVLYIKGKVPSLDDVLTIGVVGTRGVSEYGRIVTQRLSASLARSGVVTVSGLAAGVDAVGAWSTIDEGGTAVGIIGSGIDVVYPPENAELFKAIVEKGCIITEFPPGTAPLPRHFPMRNRIIAGLSRGVLVTEAPRRSGALITARIASEEGRDVFAVPGDITDIKYSGTNKIIQQGAKLVMSAEDILCEYPYAKKIVPQRKEPEKKQTNKKKSSEITADSKRLGKLSENERQIVSLLMKGDMQVDEIARTLRIPSGTLNTRLVLLEMNGVVTRLPGNMYRLKV